MAQDKTDVILQIKVDDKSIKNAKKQINDAKKDIEKNDSYAIQLGMSKSFEKQEKRRREDALKQEKAIAKAQRESAIEMNKMQTEAMKINRQMDAENKKSISSINKSHAEAISIDKKMSKDRENALQTEQKTRMAIQKSQDASINKQKEENRLIEKGKEEVRLFQAELNRKATRLTTGKNASYVDKSAVSSLQSQASGISIASVDDVAKSKMAMKEINSGMKDVQLNTQKARGGFRAFTDDLVHSASKFVEYFAVGGLIVGFLGQIQSAVQTVYALDKAITDVRIVTGETNEEAIKLVSTFKVMAKELNISITDVAKGYADLTRQGLEGKTLEDRFKYISIYSKIAGIDVEKSTELITAGVNGAKVPVEKLVDVFATLADKSSADASEIGEALSRTASVASVAGIEFEKLASYIATVSEVSRVNASVVGQSIRSMIVRFNQLRETGFNEEDTTKVNDVVQALSTIGIDAFDDATNSLMNFTDIIEALSPQWGKLDDKTRTYIQTALAGQYQADKFAIIMENQGRITELYGDALNATGSAQEKFEIYQESLQAKTDNFKRSLEELYLTIVSSDALKGMVDSSTKLIETLTLGAKNAGVFASEILILASAITVLKSSALVAEGGLLVGMGLSAPALAGIAIAVGALATAFTVYQKSLEDARISAENFKQAQEELNFVLGQGGQSAKTESETISDLVDKYDESARRIDVIRQKMQFLPAESPEFAKLLNELNVLKKEFKITSDELAKHGVTADTARQKVLELDEAYRKTIISTEKLTKLDVAQQQKKQLDTVNNLIKSYNEWADKKNKSQEEDEKLVSISGVLEGRLQDLGIAYELNSNGLISNTDNISKLILAKQNLTDTTISGIAIELNAEKNRLTTILNNIKIELEARKALAGAISVGMRPQIVQETDVGEQRTYSNTSLAGKTSGFLEGQVAQYEQAINQYSSAIDEVSKKISGVPDLLSGTGDTKAKTKTTKQSDILDRYKKQIALVEELAHQLTILKSKSELVEGDKKIEIQNKIIKGYQLQQKALSAYSDSIRATLKKGGLSAEDTEKLNDKLKENSEQWFSIQVAIKGVSDAQKAYNDNVAKETLEKAKETAEANKKLIDSFNDLVKSTIEQEMKDEIDYLKELTKNAKDVLDLKLKQLEAEKELADFSKNRAEKEKDIQVINSKITSLQTASNQGDMKAKAELLKLQEERADKQQSLDELINDRAYDLTKESLEAQYEAFEDKNDKEIKLREENLKDSEYMAKEVNKRITNYVSSSYNSLFSELTTLNNKYGSGLETDVINKWMKAIDLIKQYNSEAIKSGGQVSVSGTSQAIDKESIVAQMKMNSAEWFTATADRRKELTETNKKLASSIGYTHDPKTGAYFNAQGARLYDNGGLKPKGQLGILGENVEEWVMKDKNIMDLTKLGIQQFMSSMQFNLPQFDSIASSSGGVAPNVHLVINGNVDDTNIQRISNTIKDTVLEVSQGQLNAFKARGIRPVGRVR